MTKPGGRALQHPQSRRAFLACAAGAAAMTVTLGNLAWAHTDLPAVRALAFRSLHTGEELQATYVRGGAFDSALGLLAKEAEQQRDEAEARRLFYVACTRARERLVLVHTPRAKLPAGAAVRG